MDYEYDLGNPESFRLLLRWVRTRHELADARGECNPFHVPFGWCRTSEMLRDPREERRE